MIQFSSVLFNILEQCNIRCRHCGYEDSLRKGIMRDHHLEKWVKQVIDYGISHIIFTGGEPFIAFSLLKKAVRVVHQSGGMCSIFTNCSWAHTEAEAKKRLKLLGGLKGLYLSSDRFHLEHVPMKKVLNVISAARALSIPSIIICSTVLNRGDIEEIRNLYNNVHGYSGIHFGRIIRTDHMRTSNIEQEIELMELRPDRYSSDCFLQTPLINHTGTVSICHIGKEETHGDLSGSPYYLGNLKTHSLTQILSKAETNSLYNLLRVKGPRAIVEAALESYDRANLIDQRFASDCEMCLTLLKRKSVVEALEMRSNEASTATEVFLKRHLRLRDRYGI